jgi:hypothetical protein
MPALGSSWRPEEVNHLLTSMEEVVPLSGDDWNRVKVLHDLQYTCKNCTILALTCKFQQLYRTIKHIGDPNMPHEVEWAFAIKQMMRDKVDRTTGSLQEENCLDFDGDDGMT